jgi:hypothetical protein
MVQDLRDIAVATNYPAMTPRPGKARVRMVDPFPVIHEIRALRDRLGLLADEHEELRRDLAWSIANLHGAIPRRRNNTRCPFCGSEPPVVHDGAGGE